MRAGATALHAPGRAIAPAFWLAAPGQGMLRLHPGGRRGLRCFLGSTRRELRQQAAENELRSVQPSRQA
jgi:hypothetical protein